MGFCWRGGCSEWERVRGNRSLICVESEVMVVGILGYLNHGCVFIEIWP